jgi:hypothetical protein
MRQRQDQPSLTQKIDAGHDAFIAAPPLFLVAHAGQKTDIAGDDTDLAADKARLSDRGSASDAHSPNRCKSKAIRPPDPEISRTTPMGCVAFAGAETAPPRPL